MGVFIVPNYFLIYAFIFKNILEIFMTPSFDLFKSF